MIATANKRHGVAEACRRAAMRLAAIDLPRRCAELGLPAPQAGHVGPFRWFDRAVAIDRDGHLDDPSGRSGDFDRLILLHALGSDGVARDDGGWVTFRSFPGGTFYWQPYQRRCLAPLAAALRGADDLRKRIAGFAHRHLPGGGDVAVRIEAFGRVGLGLIYNAADDEFPAGVEVLFDPSLVGILCAEDALGLVGILCTGIHPHPCATCNSCGLCA